MSPSGFTDDTIINATSQIIVVGPNGSNNWINNTYKMSQWFNTTPLGFSVGFGGLYNLHCLYAELIEVGVIQYADFFNSANTISLDEAADTCKCYWVDGVNITPNNL